MFFEDFTRVRVYFGLPHNFHAGTFQTKVKAAYTRKQGTDGEHDYSSALSAWATWSHTLTASGSVSICRQ